MTRSAFLNAILLGLTVLVFQFSPNLWQRTHIYFVLLCEILIESGGSNYTITQEKERNVSLRFFL